MNTTTAIHESNHAAAAIMLGRVVERVWVTTGHTVAGDTRGHCQVPVGRRLQWSQLPIILAGRMDDPGWPPPYETALVEEREGLGMVLARLRASEEEYAEAVEFTRDLLADPALVRVRDAISTTLARVPDLKREDIESLCRATGTPIPESEEELLCST